jgi:hypothetical protein
LGVVRKVRDGFIFFLQKEPDCFIFVFPHPIRGEQSVLEESNPLGEITSELRLVFRYQNTFTDQYLEERYPSQPEVGTALACFALAFLMYDLLPVAATKKQ